MSKGGKTDLQREILLTWYNNPHATNKEIADICDCSASYVSNVKKRFNDYNEFEAMMDRQDKQMQQMFGDDIFASGTPTPSANRSGQQPGVAELWEEIPNNPAGIVIKGIILLVLLYVAYAIVLSLI